MSSLYADIEGKDGAPRSRWPSTTSAARCCGQPIELLTADHQNKADIAASKAREWIDTAGADDAVRRHQLRHRRWPWPRSRRRRSASSSSTAPATSALTNEQCTPYTVHYAYDTVALAKGTGGAVVKSGGKSWFFLTADYAFGHALEADTANGGQGQGRHGGRRACRHPLNASDFSSFLLQAQNSKAQILGLANAGGDTINAIKAAKEFGITKTMKLAGLLVFITDVHSLGLKNTAGLLLTDQLVLGPERRDAQVRQALLRQDQAHADRHPGGRLLGHHDLPEGGAGRRHRRRRQGDGAAEEDARSTTSTPRAQIRADGRMVHDMYLCR